MRTRWLPVVLLAVLAPVCAEYLWGYDDSTGHPSALLGNLVVFTPLYGCPALLIRELARRRGRGWPSVVLLAAAFGVTEAGLVDQSMFARDYHHIPYWHAMADPTYVAPIGLSIFLAVTFVANHVLASLVGPIALAEGLAGEHGHGRWLGRPMVVVAALLYVGASVVVYADTLHTEGGPVASLAQQLGAGVVAALLVCAALVRGYPGARGSSTRCGIGTPQRGGDSRVPGDPASAPSAWLVAPAAGLVTAATLLCRPSPLGTAALLAVYGASAGLVGWLSRRPGWSGRQAAALAGGWLTAYAVGAFWTDPIGHVSHAEKAGHNLALLVLVAALGVVAVRRSRPRPPEASVAG